MSHGSGGSSKVILLALGANLGIAISKFAGAFFTGSASLLAEAIHSLVDCLNQVFLLIGTRQSEKKPDRKHPLGYGREAFFWSFLVAILLFSVGGLFAISEGVHKLAHPEPVERPWIGAVILAFGMAMEGISFHACWKEVRARKGASGLWRWVRETKSTDLLVIFFEDFAALVGLMVALLALGAGWITENPRWDAIGSIVVGAVLCSVAFLLGREIKSLLIGESAGEEYEAEIAVLVRAAFPGGQLLHLISLQTGSDQAAVTFKFDPGPYDGSASELIGAINALEVTIRRRFPEIRWLFVEPDNLN